MKRQGQRSDLTLSPVGTKFDRSSEAITEETGDSRNQIHRYIPDKPCPRTSLTLWTSAVELSYLDEDSQRAVVDEIDLNQCTPSHDQTIRMRKFFTEGKLTPEVVSAIMSEEKPNQREKIVLRGDKVRSLIPKNIPVSPWSSINVSCASGQSVTADRHTEYVFRRPFPDYPRINNLSPNFISISK